MPKKLGLEQFSDLRGERLDKKEGGGVFEGGAVDTLMHTMVIHEWIKLEMTTRLLSSVAYRKYTTRKDAECEFLYFLRFFQGLIW